MSKPKEYPAQSYCGCCGREIAGGFFCADCGPHLRRSNLPPEERTFFAQHGKLCPLLEADLRQGCDCQCCDHAPGSDCACDCHAVGKCSAILMACPQCGAEQEDFDGFGVLACSACGYCTHPSRTGDICGLCGKRVSTCERCQGRGSIQGMEVGFGGVDQGAECGDCEGAGIIVEDVA